MKIVVLLLLFAPMYLMHGQPDFKIQKSGNERLIKALNNAEQIAKNNENYLSVRVYKLDNGPGSAESESCEVSHNILVAVSEFDTAPMQNVFEIGPFINPEFLSWSEVKEYERSFVIEYGDYDNRKKTGLRVNIDNLKVY